MSHHPPDLILAAFMLVVAVYAAAIVIKRFWNETDHDPSDPRP